MQVFLPAGLYLLLNKGTASAEGVGACNSPQNTNVDAGSKINSFCEDFPLLQEDPACVPAQRLIKALSCQMCWTLSGSGIRPDSVQLDSPASPVTGHWLILWPVEMAVLVGMGMFQSALYSHSHKTCGSIFPGTGGCSKSLLFSQRAAVDLACLLGPSLAILS